MLNSDDEDISHFIGLDEGERGDLSDLHAGTNETSLLLRTRPEAVRDNYRQLSPQPAPAPAAAFAQAARVLTAFGMSDKAAQLRTLGSIISWSSQRDWPSYIGAPAEGSARAGEAMLQGRVQLAREVFARVLQGEAVPMTPPLWWLRLLRFLP